MIGPAEQHIVYALIDPRTRLIHYVGKSVKGIKRAKQHVTEASRRDRPSVRPVCLWIKELQAAGLMYDVIVLDTHNSATQLSVVERWWIAYGRASGWPLTNATDGGEGTFGWTLSAKGRASVAAANRLRVVTAETRAKISASCKLALSSPEVRQRISEGTKAAFKLPENKAKLLARPPMSREHKDKIRATLLKFHADRKAIL